MTGKKYRISIFGLGYVGSVLAGCLTKMDFEIIGVDIDKLKVDLVNQGKSPVIEPQLGVLFKKAKLKGRLGATTDAKQGLKNSNISLVCVGTPSLVNGDINLTYLKQVIGQIAQVLVKKRNRHTLVIRSTIFPGTMENVVVPIIRKTGGNKLLKKIQLVYNPEFLRESSGVIDFFNPEVTVIGCKDKKIGQRLASFFYQGLPGKKVITDFKTAEAVKYVNNIFHGLKISFANEVGRLSKSLEIDSHKLMEIFCQDKKLNLSSAYLRPGKPFGGSCLSKDISALIYRAKKNDLNLPVIFNILNSNNIHKKTVLQLITSFNKRRIGVIGISFKENTDDLRNSPMIEMVELLIRKGYKISIFDKNISLARIFGVNKKYLLKHLPNIASLLTENYNKVISWAEIVVIANEDKNLDLSKIASSKVIIDLVKIPGLIRKKNYYIA